MPRSWNNERVKKRYSYAELVEILKKEPWFVDETYRVHLYDRCNSYTPLLVHVKADDYDCVKLLLESNASVDDDRLFRYSSPKVTQLLIDYKADVNAGRDEEPVLFEANPYARKVMLQNGADVNIRNFGDNTLLLYDSVDMSEDDMKVLLEYKADPNLEGYMGYPLNWANTIDKVKLLLEHRADPNLAITHRCQCFSTWAAYPEIPKLLLEAKMNPLLLDADGQTLLHRVATYRDFEFDWDDEVPTFNENICLQLLMEHVKNMP